MNKVLNCLAISAISLSACNTQNSSGVWTKKYEQGLYNYVNSTSKATMPDSAKRKRFVEFFVERFKQELPNGLNSVSKDSLKSLNIRIGREYAIKEHNTGNADVTPHYEAWSPFVEKAFHDNYIPSINKNIQLPRPNFVIVS